VVRFAVRWLAQRLASPRRHGPPGRDVTSSIHISMSGVPAGDAAEARLALARLPSDVPAGVAPLRSERRLDSLDPTGRLVLQACHHYTPALAEDGPVQAGLLPDMPAWLVDCALGGRGHCPHAQVLHPDQIEAAGEVGRGLLGPVPSPVGLPSRKPGEGALDLRSPIGGRSGTGQAAFQPPQPSYLARPQGWSHQQLPSRQRSRYNNTSVQPHHVSVSRCRNHWRDGRERNMPAARPIPSYPEGPCGRHWAGPAEPNPAALRNQHCAPAPVQPPHMGRSQRDDAESLVPAALAVARWRGTCRPRSGQDVCAALAPNSHRGEVVGPRLLEVSQRLLLDDHASPGQPGKRGSGLSELATLLGEPRTSPPTWLPPRPLLDRQVPHETGMRAVLQERRLLGWGRVQPIAAHSWNLAATCDNHVACRIPLAPGRKPGLPPEGWHDQRPLP
jgi:hypothetical protein